MTLLRRCILQFGTVVSCGLVKILLEVPLMGGTLRQKIVVKALCSQRWAWLTYPVST